MPRGKLLDATVLQAALEGLELQRQRVEAQIAQVRSLAAPRRGPIAAPAAAKPTRIISAAGRKRIAEAQRRRWAALKEVKRESPPQKRRLSAEGRRHIIEATRKRWAEFRATQAAKEAKAAAKKA
jgi:virulence-associated protein VagC